MPDMLRVSGSLTLGLTLAALLLPRSPSALDRGADGNFDQRRSTHFRLLQDVDIDRVTGPEGSRRFERDVLEALEDAFREVRKTLDIRPRRAIDVVIYDPGVFDQQYSTQFSFRAAGFYNGVIHVRGDIKVARGLVRTLHHEYFHAALAAVTAQGRVPAWLNEGLAEWFENRATGKHRLSQGEHAYLSQAHRLGNWVPLSTLSRPTFAGLDETSATLAYLQSYAMIEYLVRRHGERRLRSFMRRLIRGANIDWLLKREFRSSLAKLEENLRAEL
jgi:hypothetical protein